jgi:hypothetical protein
MHSSQTKKTALPTVSTSTDVEMTWSGSFVKSKSPEATVR